MRFENGNLEFRKNGKKIIAPFSFKSGDAFIYDNHQAFKLVDGERSPLTDLEKQLIDIFVNNYKVEETFDSKKIFLIQQAKKYRDMLLNQSIIYNLDENTTIILTLDITTQSSISNTINFLSLQSDDTLVEWKAKNGFFSLNITQLKSIGLFLGNKIQEAFKKESDIVMEINKATTIEDLNKIMFGKSPQMLIRGDNPSSILVEAPVSIAMDTTANTEG